MDRAGLICVAAVALSGCFSSSSTDDAGVDGRVVRLDASRSDAADRGRCELDVDPAVEERCRMVAAATGGGPGAPPPGPDAPQITSFAWTWGTPCDDGQPAWLSIRDLVIVDPAYSADEVQACAWLMGGDAGFFEARETTCVTARVGGDSLNLFVANPAGDGSMAGAVIQGCTDGSWP